MAQRLLRKYTLIEGGEIQKLQRRLIKLLGKWQIGELTTEDVRDNAEALELKYYPGDYPDDDIRSIIVESLFGLGNLHQQLFTTDDIPEFLDFLAAKGGPSAAWERWEKYSDSIDWDARARELRNDSFYASRD